MNNETGNGFAEVALELDGFHAQGFFAA